MLSADVPEFIPKALREQAQAVAEKSENVEIPSVENVVENEKSEVVQDQQVAASKESGNEDNVQAKQGSDNALSAASIVQNTYPDSTLSATSAEFVPSIEYNSSCYLGFNGPSDTAGPSVSYGNDGASQGASGFMYYGQQGAPPYGYYNQPAWATDVDYGNGYRHYNHVMPATAAAGSAPHYSGGEFFVPDGGCMFEGNEGYPNNSALIMEPSYYGGSVVGGEYGGPSSMQHMNVGRGGHSNFNRRGNNKNRGRRPSDNGGGARGGPANELRICGQTGQLTVGKKKAATAPRGDHHNVSLVERLQASTIINNKENWPTLNLGKQEKPVVSAVPKLSSSELVTEQVCVTSASVNQSSSSTLSFSSMAKKKNDAVVDQSDIKHTASNGKKKGKLSLSESKSSDSDSLRRRSSHSNSVSIQKSPESQLTTLLPQEKSDAKTVADDVEKSFESFSLVNGGVSEVLTATNALPAVSKKAKRKARKKTTKEPESSIKSVLPDQSIKLSQPSHNTEKLELPNAPEKVMYAEAISRTKVPESRNSVKCMEEKVNSPQLPRKLKQEKSSSKTISKPVKFSQVSPSKTSNSTTAKASVSSGTDSQILGDSQDTTSKANTAVSNEDSEWITVVKRSKTKKKELNSNCNEQKRTQNGDRNGNKSYPLNGNTRSRKFRDLDGDKGFKEEARNGHSFRDSDKKLSNNVNGTGRKFRQQENLNSENNGQKFRDSKETQLNDESRKFRSSKDSQLADESRKLRDSKDSQLADESQKFRDSKDMQLNCEDQKFRDPEERLKSNSKSQKFRRSVENNAANGNHSKQKVLHNNKGQNLTALPKDNGNSVSKSEPDNALGFHDEKTLRFHDEKKLDFREVNRKFHPPDSKLNHTKSRIVSDNLSDKLFQKDTITLNGECSSNSVATETGDDNQTSDEATISNMKTNGSCVSSSKLPSRMRDPNDPEVKEMLKNRAIKKEKLKHQKMLNREAEMKEKLVNARKDTKISLLPNDKSTQINSTRQETFTMISEEYPSLGGKKGGLKSVVQQPSTTKKNAATKNVNSANSDGFRTSTDIAKLPAKKDKASATIAGNVQTEKVSVSINANATSKLLLPSVDAGNVTQRKVFSYSSAVTAAPLSSDTVMTSPLVLAASNDTPAREHITVTQTKAKKTSLQQPQRSKHVKTTDKMMLDISSLIKPSKKSGNSSLRSSQRLSTPATAAGAASTSSAPPHHPVAHPAVRRVVATHGAPREKGKKKKMPTAVQLYKSLRHKRSQDLLTLLADVHRMQKEETVTDINIEGFRENVESDLSPPSTSKEPSVTPSAPAEVASYPSTSNVPKRTVHKGKINAAATAEDKASSSIVDSGDSSSASPTATPVHLECKSTSLQTLTLSERQDVVNQLGLEIGMLMQSRGRKLIDTIGRNVVTKELNELLQSVLTDLVRFQRRQYQMEPVKAKARRRFVCGLHESQRKLSKVLFIVVASDVKKNIPVVVESLQSLVEEAEGRSIPVVFGLSRAKLAVICKAQRGRRISCVAVFNYQGTEDRVKEILQLLPEAKRQWEVQRGPTDKSDADIVKDDAEGTDAVESTLPSDVEMEGEQPASLEVKNSVKQCSRHVCNSSSVVASKQKILNILSQDVPVANKISS